MMTKIAAGLVLGTALLVAAPTPSPAQHAGHGNHPAGADTARKVTPHQGHTPARPKAQQPARPATPADTAKKDAKHGGHSGHPSAMMSGTGHAEHAATPPQEGAHTGHAAISAPTRAVGKDPQDGMQHEMFMAPLGGGWALMGMAQAFPVGTWGAPFDDDSPLNDNEFYLTQPAVMLNLESPGSRVVLRTTLNFEGETQRDGE